MCVVLVLLCCQQVVQLDAACRAAGVKFMAAAAAGPAGWFFADLQQHTYTPKVRAQDQHLFLFCAS